MKGLKGIIVMILVIGVVKEGNLWRCEGCIDEERAALVQIKSSFHTTCPEIPVRDDDCCTWYGVGCDSSTGRVTYLSLNQLSVATQEWYFNELIQEWNFNATLFLSFQQLTTLDLTFALTVVSVQTQGFERLSRLKRLEDLALDLTLFKDKSILPSIRTISSLRSITLWGSTADIQGVLKHESVKSPSLIDNSSNNSIFSYLSGLSSLKSLTLHADEFNGTIDSTELSKLGKLEDLALEFNYKGNIPSLAGLQCLKSLYLRGWDFKGILDFQDEIQNSLILINKIPQLTKLENLNLSYTALNNSILKYIGNIASLKTLRLSLCGLSGSTTLQSLCNLKQLEELDISGNEFSGSLPWCIANLTSLQVFDLSNNHFIGSISMSPLPHLTSLTDLSFARNLFRVSVSLEPFFNHSNLAFLDGEDNLNVYDPEDQVHGSTPRFQLRYLYLMSSHGNPEGFPRFLSHQHNLEVLVLSNTQLGREFPYWLLQNNTKLHMLHLVNASLSGPFSLTSNHSYLESLDVSKNSLNGTIPREVGQILPSLYEFNLSQNCLVGDIPSSIGKICQLKTLDLSFNKLSGEIPEDLGVGSPSLSELVLSNNCFEGPILPNSAQWKHLYRLLVDNNYFSGNIPYSLLNITQLTMLDASHNNLSGNVPGWLANMSSLEVLDLSRNKLSKNLPAQLGPSQMREVYLSENKLQGSLGTAFHNFYQLTTLDLSHNNFQGKVPKWVGELPELIFLLLSHNNLEGEIPIQLCSLEHLSLADLSNNKLSGHVPFCIRPGSMYRKTEGSLNPYVAPSPSYVGQPLEFTTKSLTSEFQGSILEYISGIDLSCNNLSGPIPIEFGNLTMIQVLNLSHNSLTGPIPDSFSNMAQIESLDLSYNNLDGTIPTQILGLNFLSHFSVAHNNLSGKTPEMVAQFQTFDNSSYVGNPFLCGPPLTKSCDPALPPPSTYIVDEDEDNRFMDLQVFYITFVISYAVVLLSIGAILYINPYWRRRWFYMIHVMITNCSYFIEDNIFSLLKRGAS